MIDLTFNKKVLAGLLYFATSEGKGSIPASKEILYHGLAKAVIEALGGEITPQEDRLYLPHEPKIKFKEFQVEEKTYKYFKQKKEEANFNGMYIEPRIDEIIINLLTIEEVTDVNFKKIRRVPLYDAITLINFAKEKNSTFCRLKEPKRAIGAIQNQLRSGEIIDLQDIGERLEAQLLHDFNSFMRMS
ncbi:MAG: hypothetical protein Q8Q01_05675 [archaeon]|nr:hypothetical protein [archaeon]